MARRDIFNTIDCKERLLLVVIEKDKYGGYKQDLLENDLDEIGTDFCVCSRCNGVMRNACLVNGPDQNLVCEVCKIGEDSTPMVKTRKNIPKLRAKCPLLNRGCVWKGILGEIDIHLDECAEFILNCSKICGVLLKRSELQNHCENECQLRIVKCEYCEATIQYKVLENHNRICLEFPLTCPNECLKNIIRKEIKSHIEKECLNTLVTCPYKEMGCEVMNKRSELPKHEKIFESKHLDITKVFYLDKVEKMGSIMQNQKDEIEQLTARVRNVEKVCHRLRISESSVLSWAIPSIEVDELTEPIKVNSGPNEKLEEEIALPLLSKSSAEQQKSGFEEVKIESKDFEIPNLKINIKFLNQEGIACNTVYPLDIDQYIKYYEFVRIVYQVLNKGVKGVSFTSVELYSETGYPLAPTPSIYIQPLSNWGLRDNELIYAYPKKLFNNYQFVGDVECDEFVISIQLKHSQIRKEFKFNNKNHVFYSELKMLLSLDMHILIDCINIYYLNLANQCEQIAPDYMRVSQESIEDRNLSFTISDTYINNEPHSAFHSDYTPCYLSNIRSDFYSFNVYLLYLVRKYGENRDRYKLLRRLGLLRKISCSPPLVYSLYLLFTESPTSLPHRIAVNEGIITTISLFLKRSDLPDISTFPQLWMYLEEQALTPDLQLTEIYEATFISESTQEKPRDSRTRRLLEPLLPNPDMIIAKEKFPSISIHNDSKIIIILDLSSEMSLTFLGNPTFRKPNPALPHRDAAIKVIESLVDYLTSSQCKYLLGVIVISSHLRVKNGYLEIIKPTIEYGEVLKEIKSYIQELKPTYYLRSKLPDGLIVSLLDCCIDSYATPSENLRTQIFLFTNGESRIKYDETEENPFKKKLQDSSCVLNNIILSENLVHNLEELSKLTKGVHVNYKSILKCLSNESSLSAPTISVLKGMLSVSGQDANFGTYDFLSSQLAGQLIGIEEFLENSEREISEYQKANTAQSTISNYMHVLGDITAYIKSPNPFCKLYRFRNEILKWMVFMQGLMHSPFEDSVLIMELYFGELYPHHPPKLRFLSSVYHPNIDNAGYICHPILIEDYSPSVSLRQILDAIHAMLAQPIISHAVRSKVLETFQQNFKLYNEIVSTFCETLSLKDKKMTTIGQDFKIRNSNVPFLCDSTPHPKRVATELAEAVDNPIQFPIHKICSHPQSPKMKLPVSPN